MNAQDFVEDGLNADEAIEVAAILDSSGIDAIELSGGTLSFSGKLNPVRSGKLSSRDEEVFYRKGALKCKERMPGPLMLVGGIRSFEVAERLVNEGTTDYISLCLPLIREPASSIAGGPETFEKRLPFRQPVLSAGNGWRRDLLCAGEKGRTEE